MHLPEIIGKTQTEAGLETVLLKRDTATDLQQKRRGREIFFPFSMSMDILRVDFDAGTLLSISRRFCAN